MRPFVPHLYGVNDTGNPKMKEIVIENLLYGLEYGSFVDIKLGTNTLTKGKEKNLVKKGARDFMDVEVTTSHLMGFTVCGMNLKDPATGKPRDGGKVKKHQAPRNSQEAELYLENFFKYEGTPDKKGISFMIDELKKMLKYFKEENEHIIRGMSVFFVVDSEKKNYVCKLIDLVSFEHLPEDKR